MEQSRRAFFGTLIGGVATAAAVRSWPFRVFSFPSSIELAKAPHFRPLLPMDLPRPAVLIKQGGMMWVAGCVDGADLGRGCGTSYMRVGPYDDLQKLFAEGWHDPRMGLDFGSELRISRSPQPLRVGLT